MLHLSALCNPEFIPVSAKAPQNRSAPCSLELESTAVGTYGGRALINCGSSLGALVMTLFHQFSVFAASRGEGLHPKLRALLERANASSLSEISMRRDGMIQAGPSSDSEVVSSRVNVTPFS